LSTKPLKPQVFCCL